MAKDTFDREIEYLRISITDKCNLGCVYCMPGQRPAPFKESEVLTGEEIIRIARIASTMGVRQFRLTGGEPLLRQDIMEIIRGIAATGVRDVSLTTNGMFLAERAEALCDAGLGRLNISLDSLKPDRYREMTGGGDLERVLRGIEEAKRLGLDPIKINMVPIRGMNDDEIVEFARRTMDETVHIRFIEFMPSGSREAWGRDRCITSEEARKIIEDGVGPLQQREFKGRGPSRNYVLEGARGVLGFISPVSHAFCYQCNRLRVTARGRIRPCLFSKTEVDLLGPMRQGASDEEVHRLLMLAVHTKPEGNYLKNPQDAAIDTMSSIGG